MIKFELFLILSGRESGFLVVWMLDTYMIRRLIIEKRLSDYESNNKSSYNNRLSSKSVKTN